MSAIANKRETIRAVIRFFYFADDDDRLELIKELENILPNTTEKIVVQKRMESLANQLNNTLSN